MYKIETMVSDTGLFFDDIFLSENENNIDLDIIYSDQITADKQLSLEWSNLDYHMPLCIKTALITKHQENVIMINAKLAAEIDSDNLDENNFLLEYHSDQIDAIIEQPDRSDIDWNYHKTSHNTDSMIMRFDKLCSDLDSEHDTWLDHWNDPDQHIGKDGDDHSKIIEFHKRQLFLIKNDPCNDEIDYYFATDRNDPAICDTPNQIGSDIYNYLKIQEILAIQDKYKTPKLDDLKFWYVTHKDYNHMMNFECANNFDSKIMIRPGDLYCSYFDTRDRKLHSQSFDSELMRSDHKRRYAGYYLMSVPSNNTWE